jgi:hypothetical protein
VCRIRIAVNLDLRIHYYSDFAAIALIPSLCGGYIDMPEPQDLSHWSIFFSIAVTAAFNWSR